MININSDKAYFETLDINHPKTFPVLTTGISFNPFRHIPNLEIEFKNPISVISGTNRSGKSTILMALACSHYQFQKRNPKNGNLERNTWSSIMKFTSHDQQKDDWQYSITYKTGDKVQTRSGMRKMATKKWSGIGKKESQYKMRPVYFIDLDRVVPARFFNEKILTLSKGGTLQNVSAEHVEDIEKYMSYVLEEKFEIKKIAQHLDKDVFKYENVNHYSSYNAASGEEVLTRIIIDIVEADNGSLVLIDEIEMALHPKVQRRLMDVIRNISRNTNKQFIITTHSSTILDAVDVSSRIFIEKNHQGQYRAIQNISVNAALSKMDAKAYPVIDLYCEDEEAKKIILKGIEAIEQDKTLTNFSDLINIIISDSASKTYTHFTSHLDTYKSKKISCGCACVLDGDMRSKKSKSGELQFPPHQNLHFLYSHDCPERFLTKAYLNKHENGVIKYYLDNENPHYLFQAIIDNSSHNSKEDVFEYCWKLVLDTEEGKIYFKILQDFLIDVVKEYSLDN